MGLFVKAHLFNGFQSSGFKYITSIEISNKLFRFPNLIRIFRNGICNFPKHIYFYEPLQTLHFGRILEMGYLQYILMKLERNYFKRFAPLIQVG